MTPADVLTRRTLLAASTVVALASGAALASPATAEVVRITSVPGRDSDAPDAVAVAAFPATARSERILGATVTGLPDEPSAYEASPVAAGPVAYLGATPTAADADDPSGDAPRRPAAGLLPVGGGPVAAFSGPTGGPLGRAFRSSAGFSNDRRTPSITWASDGSSLILHAFARDPRPDPWFAAPDSRRCDARTLRCAAPVRRDVVDLVGGGTVEVESGITAPIDTSRSLGGDDADGRATAAAFRTRAGRRFAVTVRVAGRPGTGASWTTSGVLREGAPAFDRSVPSAAGVLVRTSRVRSPRARSRSGDGFQSVAAEAGRAVIVRRDGTIRSLGRFGYEVVGTLPDGRWVLTGGPGERFERGPTGLPLQTLDVDGRIAPITSGARPVSPVWAASTAGLPDSLARTAKVERASVDTSTGLLVLVMRFQDDFGGGRAIAVTPDGSAPPRLLRDGPGRPSGDELLVR